MDISPWKFESSRAHFLFPYFLLILVDLIFKILFLFKDFKKKMNNIKNKFSIKDLENLTGIKAHTIRIWEKRYNLLKPKRTGTNIRYYDLASFQ